MRALILSPFSDAYLARLRRSLDVVHESWLDTHRLYDPEELGERLHAQQIEVLIVEADFVLEEVFAVAPGLRLVGICRNALNHVDVDAASEHGVAVTHARGRNMNAVAEMTVGLMLSLARCIPQAHMLVAGGAWRDPASAYQSFAGCEIAGSTVGVIGLGQIGREVARKSLALGARVLVHDPFVADTAIRALGAKAALIEDITTDCDFITLHVASAVTTEHLVDRAFLSRMKRSAYLINTSAGDVVDTPALVAALAARTIAGAALDVFEGQPLPLTSPLLTAPNIILTPHIAGATNETVARQSRMMTLEVERLIAGKPLRYIVNPQVDVARAR